MDEPHEERSELVLKEATRRRLRRLTKTFRPIRWAEVVGFGYLALFFFYYGLCRTGLMALLAAPSWVCEGTWQYPMTAWVAGSYGLISGFRHFVRKNLLQTELGELLGTLDEISGGWRADRSAHQDAALVQDAFGATSRVLFRGRYALLWSLLLAAIFILVCVIELARATG